MQEEALEAFVQPEILEGTNQYFCEKCNKKCNAHKVSESARVLLPASLLTLLVYFASEVDGQS